ncbi:MAG: PorV/PorQ family protein [Bacteroidota bacterium]
MKRFSISLVLLLIVCGMNLEAQNRKAGINSAAFLKVGVGARQVGMGSATTAMVGDASNLFWNPAGIGLREDRMQVSFSYNKWIGELTQNALAATYNLDDIGTIGIGVMTFGLSGIAADRDVYPGNPALQALQIDQQTSSSYDYMDLLVQASFSRYVTDRLSLGVSVKYISEKIDDQSAGAIAFDFGSVYSIGVMNWKIGARINNLGGDIKFYDYASPIPLTFSIGTSIAPLQDENSMLTVAVDAVKPQDGAQFFFTGVEYMFMNMISVRGGYKLNYSGADDGGSTFRDAIKTTIEGFSAGAGFNTTVSDYGVRLDYSYTSMDILDAAHRVTLAVSMK